MTPKNQKLISTAVALVVGIITANLVSNSFKRRADAASLGNLLKMAGEVNKSLPMMVDQETQLTNVTAKEKAIVYVYTLVNRRKAEINAEELVKALKPGMIQRSCTTPDTYRSFLKNGVSMDYKYYDKSGQFVVEIDVTPADCAEKPQSGEHTSV